MLTTLPVLHSGLINSSESRSTDGTTSNASSTGSIPWDKNNILSKLSRPRSSATPRTCIRKTWNASWKWSVRPKFSAPRCTMKFQKGGNRKFSCFQSDAEFSVHIYIEYCPAHHVQGLSVSTVLDYRSEHKKEFGELRCYNGAKRYILIPSFRNPNHHPRQTNLSARRWIWRYHFQAGV